MKMAVKSELNSTTKRKAAQAVKFCVKQERNVMLKKVYALLKKTEVDRSEEEKHFLLNYIDLVKEVRRRIERQKKLKERLKEVEDPPDVIAKKCIMLAEALSASRRLVVYTGAGVSTAACIPDYRGSNGIWTLLQQGKDVGLHDLSKADPTLTHMSLTKLYQVGIIKHVVSQNCDGLHLRSGLPREALSEVHGNMYVEVCRQCQPVREYLRLFDVTENTGRFNHRTGRRCYKCSGALVDSIVHFGERGTLKWPLNWPGAVTASANADTILCIGSSLKVLKRYPWLWGMDKHPKKRPKLYIVNLQWTPKDDQAVLKINARCDSVMEQVMQILQLDIPKYNRLMDPIFVHATSLNPAETHTTTKPLLTAPLNKFASTPEQISQEILSVVKHEKNNVSSSQINQELDVPISSVKPENKNENCVAENICKMHLVEEKRECQTHNFNREVSKSSCMICVSDPLIIVKKELCPSEIVRESHAIEEAIRGGSNFRSGNESIKHSSNDSPFSGNSKHRPTKNKYGSSFHEDLQVKREFIAENASYDEPFMDIIYEGVKLKVEENVSVDANVKINNDMLILCDTPSIHCNSFIFNSSYEFEESDNDFKFVNVNNSSSLNDSDLCTYRISESSNSMSNNAGINDEEYKHGKKMLSFFYSNEHNYSQSTSAHEYSSDNQIRGASSSQIKTQVQDKCSSHSANSQKESPRKCVCCSAWYGASDCLFYLPVEPVFQDRTAGVCECCSDDSEEEEDIEDNEKKENKDEMCNPVKPVTNPGWYGKGYRKRIKKKR
ncbi:NAD-dependent protein deacetylase Sirt7 [Gryllus bimaculatus]|nr:NAD-dependent protein deacetylase Sirt7 [Gryllus bimaculatus]